LMFKLMVSTESNTNSE